MNREILFRGKRVDNGEWIEGFFAKSGDKTFILIDNDIAVGYVAMKEVIAETVGQFTGLTDKNGTNIFEGDIVKYTNTQRGVYEIGQKMRGVVVFDEKIGCYISKNNFQRHPDFWFSEDIEVIGNIFDNPGLLEEKE